jgi:hypothetical protein
MARREAGDPMIPDLHDCVLIACFGLLGILELCALRLWCEWGAM